MKQFLIHQKIIIAIFIGILCCGVAISLIQKKDIVETKIETGGSSGMTQIGKNSFLVVYDVKHHVEGTRLAKIKVSKKKKLSVTPIEVTGWGIEGRGSDIESICAIPDTKNEYLMAESGNWEGKRGRIFHIQYNEKKNKAKVLNVIKIPQLKVNNKDTTGDNYEAIACFSLSKHKRILMLGERGGSKNNPRGVVRWGVLNLKDKSFKFSEEGVKGIPVNAPGNWLDVTTKRDLTDFHIDKEGVIWASASNDLGDLGPFYSVVYKLGKTDPANPNQPFYIDSTFNSWESVAGFKVEALSGASEITKGNLSISTEDEDFAGVWRQILIQ